MKRAFLVTLVGALLASTSAQADTVSVAVAANFTKVAEELAPLFKAETGHDVTYSTSLDLADGKAVLEGGVFDKIAIADPAAAPYGRAATETIAALGLTDAIAPKLVTGENISQTLQFVESGNAELGFVAASQVVGKSSVWIVPAELFEPIRQDAVLLKTGEANAAATAYIDFLKSEKAVAVITAAGYVVE